MASQETVSRQRTKASWSQFLPGEELFLDNSSVRKFSSSITNQGRRKGRNFGQWPWLFERYEKVSSPSKNSSRSIGMHSITLQKVMMNIIVDWVMRGWPIAGEQHRLIDFCPCTLLPTFTSSSSVCQGLLGNSINWHGASADVLPPGNFSRVKLPVRPQSSLEGAWLCHTLENQCHAILRLTDVTHIVHDSEIQASLA
jgi:hypothetical protein